MVLMHDIVHIIKIIELCSFKMVAMVRVMLYAFYLNFKEKKHYGSPTKMCYHPKICQLCFKWRNYCLYF